MYFERQIDQYLIAWKNQPERKPLLIRGARQVGKSSSVLQLAKGFPSFVSVNFEESPQVKSIFTGDLNPHRIAEALSVYYGQQISPGETLVFFDEIQACPEAISALRFFYEKMPDLHVIAAGSLLEFALQSLPSYGVGRVRSLFMYPFSFDEFLLAMGEKLLLEAKKRAHFLNPLDTTLHAKLLEYLKIFLLTGGMPEAVGEYVNTRRLLESQLILDDIYTALRTDFAKYKQTVPPGRLRAVFESVVQQAGGKFVYAKAASESSYQQIKEALDLLIMAGWVIPITHTASNGLPLGAEVNLKKRKMILLDTGVFQRILGLDLSDFLFSDAPSPVNKGAIAEQFWGLEFLKYINPWSPPALYYWHREARNANAEVDYVIAIKGSILPVEIKSSGSGSMQSLYQFLEDKKQSHGYRFSLENFSEYDRVKSVPLYAVSSIANTEWR